MVGVDPVLGRPLGEVVEYPRIAADQSCLAHVVATHVGETSIDADYPCGLVPERLHTGEIIRIKL
jgi:hypothetical protein